MMFDEAEKMLERIIALRIEVHIATMGCRSSDIDFEWADRPILALLFWTMSFKKVVWLNLPREAQTIYFADDALVEGEKNELGSSHEVLSVELVSCDPYQTY